MTSDFQSIIDELDRFMPERSKYRITEARADHAIKSVINLMDDISENFSEDEAKALNRRLLNAISSHDASKFQRKIRQLNESNKKAKAEKENDDDK